MRRNALPIFIFVMIGLVVYGIVSLNKKSAVADRVEEDVVIEAPTPPSQMAAAVQNAASPQGQDFPQPSANERPSQSGSVPATAADVNNALKQMGKCLNLDASEFDSMNDVTAANFQAALPYDLGMVLFEEDVWSSKTIRLPNGEQRKVMVSFLPGPPGRALKRLSYSAIQNGQSVDLPLESEQKNNPSDSLIASLESDGEVVNRLSKKKIFLQHGGEVQMFEENGVLSAFELAVDGRTFHCGNGLKNCECP